MTEPHTPNEFRIPDPEEWAARADRAELHRMVVLAVAEWIDRRKPIISQVRMVCARYGVQVRFDVTRCGQDIDFERINVTTRNDKCRSVRVG